MIRIYSYFTIKYTSVSSLAAFLILCLLILFKRSILLSITDLSGRLILTEKFNSDLSVEMDVTACPLFSPALSATGHQGHVSGVYSFQIEVVQHILTMIVLCL